MDSGGSLGQIVYLSNRPAVLAETLAYVRHFMPWVTRAVVLTPSPDAIRRAVGDTATPELVLLADSEVLAKGEEIPRTHSARNAFLRRALAERGPIDDVFLQSDDDYRPPKAVPQSFYVDDD